MNNRPLPSPASTAKPGRKTALLALACVLTAPALAIAAETPSRPNIIYILADDLGYGDLGCYGQKTLATPNIDYLASSGMRFTQHYASNTVCTVSRSSLLTGLHAGHTRHRDNPRFVDSYGFEPGDTTFAEVLKTAGYATALCGKWHVGDRADTRDMAPYHGFDFAYTPGYPYPDRGWEHWPSHVFVNGRQTPVAGNGDGRKAHYMDDLYTDAALGFMRERRDRPFIIYLSFQGVHAPMDAAIDARYADQDWPEPEKAFASALTRVDENVGRVLETLLELGLEANTVVFFSSDNGPHAEGGHNQEFFHSRGGLRGKKRDLYEGGIRVPLIARWPEKIPAGTTSAFVTASWDMFATFAELGGAVAPQNDGRSIVPTLQGQPQSPHEALYWETGELDGSQAVRLGNWKGIRHNANLDADSPFELYDLATDPTEIRNLAADQPEIVQRVRTIARESHTPSPYNRLAEPVAHGAK